jgi:hypothetical protein
MVCPNCRRCRNKRAEAKAKIEEKVGAVKEKLHHS